MVTTQNRRLKELFIRVVVAVGVGREAGLSGMMAGMIGVRVGRSLVGKMASMHRVNLSQKGEGSIRRKQHPLLMICPNLGMRRS